MVHSEEFYVPGLAVSRATVGGHVSVHVARQGLPVAEAGEASVAEQSLVALAQALLVQAAVAAVVAAAVVPAAAAVLQMVVGVLQVALP